MENIDKILSEFNTSFAAKVTLSFTEVRHMKQLLNELYFEIVNQLMRVLRRHKMERVYKITKKMEHSHFRQLYQIVVYKYVTLQLTPNKHDLALPDWDEDLETLSSVHMSVSVDESQTISINIQSDIEDSVLEHINSKRIKKMEYPTNTNVLDKVVYPVSSEPISHYNGIYPCSFDVDGPKYVVWVQYSKVNEVFDVLAQLVHKKGSGIMGFITETSLTKQIGDNGYMVEIFIDGSTDTEQLVRVELHKYAKHVKLVDESVEGGIRLRTLKE